MKEKIQQVLEIEKQAQEIQEKAKREAQELPVRAEQEAQALIFRAKAEAEEEARKIIAAAKSADSAQGVSAEVGEKTSQFDALAKKNFDRAVAFVLDRVIGKA
jgi:vacuolar-type H+-ATPase subunit E/Vma4